MTVDVHRYDDDHIVARIASGSPVSAIVSDDPVERSSRLEAVMTMAAAAGIRMHRVSNGLRAPLTLPRIAFQLASDADADADDAAASAPTSPPNARTVLIIEQAETLAPDALSVMRGMSVQLLLVGSSDLRPMLAAFESEPSTPGAGDESVLLNSHNSALQDDCQHGRIDNPAWAHDWDDDPLEHASSRAAVAIAEPLSPKMLRAVRPPNVDPQRAARGPLWIAAVATVAIVIAAATLGKPASVEVSPPDRAQAATPSAADAPGTTEASAVARLTQTNQLSRPTDPQELGHGSPPLSPPPVLPPSSEAKAYAIASSAMPSAAVSPSGSGPANSAAALPAESAAKLRRQFETFLRLPENRRRHFSPEQKAALFTQYTNWRAQQAGAVAGPGL